MGKVAWWVKFVPRAFRHKYFVVAFRGLPPSVLPIEIWGLVGQVGVDRVVARDLTYEEAKAIALLLPMGDRHDG